MQHRFGIGLAAALAAVGCLATAGARSQQGQGPDLQLTLKMRWDQVGNVRLDPKDGLRFPRVRKGPGIYRFVIRLPGSMECYVGESVSLKRRFNKYRFGRRAKGTTKRIRDAIYSTLKLGGDVAVEIVADQAQLCRQSSCEPADLLSTNRRLLLERLAILEHACILNIDRTFRSRQLDY